MKNLPVVCLALLTLFACNNNTSHTAASSNNSWSEAEQNAFVKTCIPQAQQSANMDADKAKNYCDCMLGKVEEKYPKAVDAAGLTAADASAMAKECLKQ